MAGDTLTLVLSGNLDAADFARAVNRWLALVRALTAEVTPGSRIRWIIDDLEAGSAITTIRGLTQNGDGPAAVESVTRAYIEVGRALGRHAAVPYSTKVQKNARELTRVLKRSVESIRFETAEADATITMPIKSSQESLQVSTPSERGAYGAIEGRVQTLTNRGGLRFTLYDMLYDRAVSCYLVEGREDIMRDVWGKRAIVEGWVSRDPVTGRPETIRRVSEVTIVPDGDQRGYRAARGVVPLAPDALAPEKAVRRLRDA